MNDPLPLLAWLQLHDSAFPSGRFAHSSGIESWLYANPHADADEICSLAITVLKYGFGTLDAVTASYAWAANSYHTLVELDDLLTSYKLSENGRTASQACGHQLATVLLHLSSTAWSPQTLDYLNAVKGYQVRGNLSIVEGASQRSLGIEKFEAVLGGIRSIYADLLSAAVRLGRLSALRAQREILQQRKELTQLTRTAIEIPLTEIHSATVELEIYGMLHETRSARMFAT